MYTYIHICIYTHIHNGIVLSHKKNEILPHATGQMTLEGTMLSEKSQKEKDKYCMISLLCVIKKKKNNPRPKINEQTKPNKNKQVAIENRAVMTSVGGVG